MAGSGRAAEGDDEAEPVTAHPADPGAVASLPRGVVTFLLTDLEGSSVLWESHAEQMADVVQRHYDLLHDAVRAHRGALPLEQGEGDSVVAAFERGSDAVAAAVAAQQAILAEPWPAGIDVRVRMALHSGEARLRARGAALR